MSNNWSWLRVWITDPSDNIDEKMIYANLDECIESQVLEEFELEWGKNIKDFKWLFYADADYNDYKKAVSKKPKF